MPKEDPEKIRKNEIDDKFISAWALVLDVDIDDPFECCFAFKGLDTKEGRYKRAYSLGYYEYSEDEDGLPIFGIKENI